MFARNQQEHQQNASLVLFLGNSLGVCMLGSWLWCELTLMY